jgi:hypothetical protein
VERDRLTRRRPASQLPERRINTAILVFGRVGARVARPQRARQRPLGLVKAGEHLVRQASSA